MCSTRYSPRWRCSSSYGGYGLIRAGRLALLVLPALAYYAVYRLALNLQQHDRKVLHEGIETGVIRRSPEGRYFEIRQPIRPVDEHGDGQLPYRGWVIPKRINEVHGLRRAVLGFFMPVGDGQSPAQAGPDSVPDPAVPTAAAPHEPTRQA